MFCVRYAILVKVFEKAYLEIASVIFILFKNPSEMKFRIVCLFKSYAKFL